MTLEEVKKRLIAVRGQSQREQVAGRSRGRRGINHVEIDSEFEGDEFDDFFDFEEDLAGLESARSQAEKARYNEMFLNDNIRKLDEEIVLPESVLESFFTLDDVVADDVQSGDQDSFFSFDEIEVKSDNIKELEIPIENNEKTNYTKVAGFDFKYCSFIKKDGQQCKRQAPSDGEYCKSHRK